jgi:hypothetical protein
MCPGAFQELPRREAGLEAALLAGLMALLPFEPRRPILALAGLEVTLLEAAAAFVCLGLLWSNRRSLGPLLLRPRAPLVFVTLLAGAHVVSSLRAPVHGDLALKFSGRMVAMAALAWIVAATPKAARHAGLWGLCAGSALVALLAILEGLGLRGLDPVLDLFREVPVNVAGARRATAGSAYPNLAAGFLACGLACTMGLRSARPAPVREALPLCAFFSLGILFTYSRGGLLATAAALLALSAVLYRRQPAQAKLPLLALGIFLATCGAFAATGDVFRLRLSSEGADSWYGAAYDPLEISMRLEPREVRRTYVRVSNSGRKPWAAAEGFDLSYHWYGLGWDRLIDGRRTRLPRDLAPGEGMLLNAEIQAPDERGRFILVWDMVQEHTTWFSGQGVKPRVVPVAVGMGTLADNPAFWAVPMPEVGWHPSRGELWRLAFGMWKERPITGVGSDNFRRLYGPRAGRPFWDARIYANSLFLETAATTGMLGLLALVAVLASAAFRSARFANEDPSEARHRNQGAILLALWAALVTHGAVDYSLAFTGHYLLFGFVVGASAALSARGEES